MNENMRGYEHVILKELERIAFEFGEITYLEIGVALGETLFDVSNFLKSLGKPWRAIGVDIPNGWSLNEQFIEGSGIKVIHQEYDLDNFVVPKWGETTVYIVGQGRSGYLGGKVFLDEFWRGEDIHACLIDGCHSEKCCTNDLVSVSRHVPKNGLVMLHDFGEREQGTDIQPHCNLPIDTRKAAIKANIFEDWLCVHDLAGNRRGIGIFLSNGKDLFLKNKN